MCFRNSDHFTRSIRLYDTHHLLGDIVGSHGLLCDEIPNFLVFGIYFEVSGRLLALADRLEGKTRVDVGFGRPEFVEVYISV